MVMSTMQLYLAISMPTLLVLLSIVGAILANRSDAKVTRALFKTVDARFDTVDKTVDARFDTVDARLKGHDARFDGIHALLNDLRADVRVLTAEIREDNRRLNDIALKHTEQIAKLEAR